jgi:hypothetical protein
VREPVQRLCSAWRYYTRIGVLKQQPLENLLKDGVQVHSEFHPNGIALELAGVGFEEHARSILNNERKSDEKVAALVAAAWQPGAPNDALIAAGSGVVAAIRARNLIALVTERLDESLRLLLWPRAGWQLKDLHALRHVEPSRLSPDPGSRTALCDMEPAQLEAIRKSSFLDTEVYAVAVHVLEEAARERRATAGNNAVSKSPSCANHSGTTAMHAVEACASILGQMTKNKEVSDLVSCQCTLLGLDDVHWAEFAHHPSLPARKNHSLSPFRKAEVEDALTIASEEAIAPTAHCTLGRTSILCSVASESLLVGVNRRQFAFGGQSAAFELVSFGSSESDVVGSGCKAEEMGAIANNTLPYPSRSTIGRATIVKRGGCSFAEKARHLESAGFEAMFVIDNEEGHGGQGLPTPSLGPGSGVTIPVFMLAYHDGMFAASQSKEGCVYIEATLE